MQTSNVFDEICFHFLEKSGEKLQPFRNQHKWAGSYFNENSFNLYVTLLKDGSDVGPEISNLILEGYIGSNNTELRSFHCGSFSLDHQSQQSKSCVNEVVFREYSHKKMLLDRVIVQIGEDGTDDDVSLTVLKFQIIFTQLVTTKE